MRRVLAALPAALTTGLAVAQGQVALPEYQPGRYLLQALFSLIIVVGLIYGVFHLLRRLQSPALRLNQQGPAELVQSVPLAGANVLHVVRVNGRLVGLAAGPQGVRRVDLPQRPAEGGEGD